MITPDRIVSTTCPYCGVGCNLHLHIKDDFIYRVTSPHDAVVNHGNLCVKGRFGYDFMYHPDRVTTPLIRKTLQQPGARTQAFDRSEWREASWDEALDYVADRLVEIYQRDGSRAMAAYCCAKATNEDNYLLQKMFRTLFRTNNIDHCTRLCHAGSVVALLMSLGTTAMSNTAAEVIHNDCFIVTGSNTTENHPIIALQMKEAVRKRGARLIVIDPRRLELCDFATLWLPLKPGANVPIFSAMAHVIVKEGLVNRDFIATRTTGYDEFVRSLEPFTPEHVEAISGVDRALIVEAARLYATAKNGAIYWGMGISQFSNGTAGALGLIHLALLTGHIGRLGTGLNPLRGQNNVQGASDAGAMPFHYPGYMEVDKEENARKWEQAWHIEPGGLNRTRGLTTTEILTHAHPGGVRALYIMGENPMMTEPNLNVTRQHMKDLEFLVTQDIFINESGAFADVFLPAVSWAEKEGTFTNTDRRVQRVRRAIAPRGQARPDSAIICDLARRIEARLGRPTSAGWSYDSPQEVYREMARVATMFEGHHLRPHRTGGPAISCARCDAPRHALPLCRNVPGRARALLPAGVRARCRGSRRRVPLHPDHRAAAGALARRHVDSPLPARRALPVAVGGNARNRRGAAGGQAGRRRARLIATRVGRACAWKSPPKRDRASSSSRCTSARPLPTCSRSTRSTRRQKSPNSKRAPSISRLHWWRNNARR
jgi:predicted molibdopterin-dependent oxidoreductase YjgC